LDIVLQASSSGDAPLETLEGGLPLEAVGLPVSFNGAILSWILSALITVSESFSRGD